MGSFSALHEVTKVGSCKCCEGNTMEFSLKGFDKGLILLQRETHLENLSIELLTSRKAVGAIMRKKSHLISWKNGKWREYILIAVILLTLWDSSIFQWSLNTAVQYKYKCQCWHEEHLRKFPVVPRLWHCVLLEISLAPFHAYLADLADCENECFHSHGWFLHASVHSSKP